MAYTFTNSKGTTYTLHRVEAATRGGQTRTLHFFAREAREGAIQAIPAGYTVVEAPSGMPVLKKA